MSASAEMFRENLYPSGWNPLGVEASVDCPTVTWCFNADVKGVTIGSRRVPLAVIVLVSSLALGACGGTPLASTATVPWRPIPASPTTTTTTTTLAPASPSEASQLQARKVFGGVGLGNVCSGVETVWEHREVILRLAG